MSTRIRLSRVGRKKQAAFRIVVADSIHPRSGRFTEQIGKYNPRTRPSFIEVDTRRALHWLYEGAGMSDSVRSLFRKTGVLRKFAEGVKPADVPEGEGVVTIGDVLGKTVLATAPAAARSGRKAEAAEAAEAAPAAEAEPAAESESKPAAPAEGEPETEPEAEAESETKAEAATDAEAEAEMEAETEAEDEVESPEGEADSEADESTGDDAEEDEESEKKES